MYNVLFIVYYFPPMGSSGVQRPLKFVKYLRHYGWNPIVLAPEPGAYHTFDESLQQELEEMDVEVHRVGAKTPFHLMGKTGRQINFIPPRIAGWIRKMLSFFYLPDNKTGWIKPALSKAEQIMADKDIDVIFSTATPYSNHLISAELKRRTGKPVIMDFRDDWLEFPFSDYATRFHRKRAAQIERDCIKYADIITANNSSTLNSIKSRTPNPDTRFQLLSHGFDSDDFDQIMAANKNDRSKIRFLYSGIFYGDRNPDVFFNALSGLIKDGKVNKGQIEIQFQGGLDHSVKDQISRLGFDDICTDYGLLPHKMAVQNLVNADVLWLLVGHQRSGNLVTPGKLFEYMATRKPILGLVPDGDAKVILKSYKAGFTCDPYDTDEVKNTLESTIYLWQAKNMPQPDEEFIKRHDRKLITGELAALFDELVLKQSTD